MLLSVRQERLFRFTIEEKKERKKVIIYHFLPSYTKDIVVFSGTFNTNYASQKLYDTNKVLTE